MSPEYLLILLYWLTATVSGLGVGVILGLWIGHRRAINNLHFLEALLRQQCQAEADRGIYEFGKN